MSSSLATSLHSTNLSSFSSMGDWGSDAIFPDTDVSVPSGHSSKMSDMHDSFACLDLSVPESSPGPREAAPTRPKPVRRRSKRALQILQQHGKVQESRRMGRGTEASHKKAMEMGAAKAAGALTDDESTVNQEKRSNRRRKRTASRRKSTGGLS